MREEIFGPVLTVYVYRTTKWDETLELVDKSAPYALTGAIFSDDGMRSSTPRRRSATRPATST